MFRIRFPSAHSPTPLDGRLLLLSAAPARSRASRATRVRTRSWSSAATSSSSRRTRGASSGESRCPSRSGPRAPVTARGARSPGTLCTSSVARSREASASRARATPSGRQRRRDLERAGNTAGDQDRKTGEKFHGRHDAVGASSAWRLHHVRDAAILQLLDALERERRARAGADEAPASRRLRTSWATYCRHSGHQAHNTPRSSSIASNGATRARSSPRHVPLSTQRRSSSRYASSTRSTGSMSHAHRTSSRA